MEEVFVLLRVRSRKSGFKVSNLNCHPERSEGPALFWGEEQQVLRFAQDDDRGTLHSAPLTYPETAAAQSVPDYRATPSSYACRESQWQSRECLLL